SITWHFAVEAGNRARDWEAFRLCPLCRGGMGDLLLSSPWPPPPLKSSRLKPLVCCCLSGWRDQSRIWPELGTDRGRPRPAPHHGAYQESIGLLHQDRRSLQASATVSPDKPIHPSLEALTWQC